MNLSKRFSIILLSLILILSCLPISAMAADNLVALGNTNDKFMYLEGIQGESKNPDFPNWIELRSFGHSSSVEEGRHIFEMFTFKHLLDKSTPKIQEYCMNGESIPTGEIAICRYIAGSTEIVYRIKMSDITVKNAIVSVEYYDDTYQLVEEVNISVGKSTWIVNSPVPETTLPDDEDSYGGQFDQNRNIEKVMANNSKVKSIKPYKKSMTVKWKPNNYASGYQIKYSTNKNFKNAKTITVAKTKASSKKITKLRRHKKYYVKIRAYYKNEGLEVYSAWGPKKSAKTK